MRTAHLKAAPINGFRTKLNRHSMSPKRSRPGDKRAREAAGHSQGSVWRGLRWVPVPLAVLAALLGLMVVGSLQGQAAAELAHIPYRAGGLSLSVDTMQWMESMSMSAPGSAKGSYQMPDSMMPGMQTRGDSRLRLEVDLRNIGTGVQRYSLGDFRVTAPGGKSWKPYTSAENSVPVSAILGPGFQTTIDVYFDIPTKQARHLSIRWTRDGSTVAIPVHAVGSMSGMQM
jgi:hypothetical protein